MVDSAIDTTSTDTFPDLAVTHSSPRETVLDDIARRQTVSEHVRKDSENDKEEITFAPTDNVVDNEWAKEFGIQNLPSVPPFDTRVRDRFIPLNEWEGVVEEIGDDEFTTRLCDLSQGRHAVTEHATFPASDLTKREFDSLLPGAVIRWTIGVVKTAGGMRSRTSRIIVRQLPRWTESSIRKADAEAQKLADYFSDID